MWIMNMWTGAKGKDYRVVGYRQKEERLGKKERKRKINQNLPDTKDPLIQPWPFLTQPDSSAGLDDESRGGELPAGLQMFPFFVSHVLILVCVTGHITPFDHNRNRFWVWEFVSGLSCGLHYSKLCGYTIQWTSQLWAPKSRQGRDFWIQLWNGNVPICRKCWQQLEIWCIFNRAILS